VLLASHSLTGWLQRPSYCRLLDQDLMQRLPGGRGPSVTADVMVGRWVAVGGLVKDLLAEKPVQVVLAACSVVISARFQAHNEAHLSFLTQQKQVGGQCSSSIPG
jgi:hypothetical protein